jgi:hypothetical protein
MAPTDARGILLRFNLVRVPATSSRATTSEHDDHRRAYRDTSLPVTVRGQHVALFASASSTARPSAPRPRA